MLIGGFKIDGPRIETVVIPFGERELVFKAQLVRDFKEFHQRCPSPIPPEKILKGGIKQTDIDDPEYKRALGDWALKRTHYLYIKSLEATPDLKWETVDISNPDTYKNFEEELLNAGLSGNEISRILNIVHAANGLDQDKIDEATKRFLAGQAEANQDHTSQNTEPTSTESGALAKG